MIYLLVARVHNDFVRTDCFSNENGVSLRLCNVEELVLLGPCFADVNVETVTHTLQKWVFYQRIFGLFCGASEPLFIMCGGFVVYRCRRPVFEALRCFVFLWLKEITLFNEI